MQPIEKAERGPGAADEARYPDRGGDIPLGACTRAALLVELAEAHRIEQAERGR